MSLFDNIARADPGPSGFSEGAFAYYNRSARPEVGRVRELLERWVDAYPERERMEMVSRLREDHTAFAAAFFELFLYQLLVSLGHSVVPHPDLTGSDSKRPDFLATPIAGAQPIVVEAVLATAETEEQRAEKHLQDRIQDDINSFRHPDFFFVLAKLEGQPLEYPRRAILHGFLRDVLSGLDADEVARQIEVGKSPSRGLRRRFVHQGLVIELYPWPKSPASRGDSTQRSIGGGPVQVVRSTARAALRAAVKKKASRYGELPWPYIVAVNCTARWGVEDEEVREALLGQEQLRLSAAGKARLVYDGEGAFTHRHKPTNTRVSAVLVCRELAPHSVPRADIRLYHHLLPKRPYAGPLDQLPQAQREGNVLAYGSGTAPSLAELFGLWPEWPYDSGDPRGSGWRRMTIPEVDKE